MFPKTIKIGSHITNYDLFYKTMFDALGHSVTKAIDESNRDAHSESSFFVSIAAANGDTRPVSDILRDDHISLRHLFYSFLVVHTRPLITDFNNYSDLDVTEFQPKNRLYLYLVSGRARDFRHALFEYHEAEEDFKLVLDQIRNLLRHEGFWNLVTDQKVKGVLRLL